MVEKKGNNKSNYNRKQKTKKDKSNFKKEKKN